MKKYLLMVLVLLLLIVSPIKVGAEEQGEGTTSAKINQPDIKYDLPYPGILPDSPLWVIKDLRDQFLSLFLFDPVAKEQYYLNLADKRLAAGLALINGRKVNLGVQTVNDAEKYLSLSWQVSRGINPKQPERQPFLGKILLASQKHAEVIKNAAGKLGNSSLDPALSSAIGVANQIQKLFEERLQITAP